MIAVDTNILVWGVRKAEDETRPDIVERCVHLIDDYKQRKIVIMIPSPVLGEFLIGYTIEQQREVLSLLTKAFFIAPFDFQAAAVAAELYSKAQFDQIREQEPIPRQCLKVDYMVAATAIRHGATTLFVNDGHFKTIAAGRIIVSDIPQLRNVAASTDGELERPAEAPAGRQRQTTLENFGDPESATGGS